jgi:hypothetical protein
VKIIRHTDFLSIDKARKKGIERGRPAKKKESKLREEIRTTHYERERPPIEGFFGRR